MYVESLEQSVHSKNDIIISCYVDINSLFWKAQVQSNLEGKSREPLRCVCICGL